MNFKTTCPKTQVLINTDCIDEGCIYHTRYKNIYNCCLIYMEQQGSNQLSLYDISLLVGKPIKTIKKDFNTALKILREQVPNFSSLEKEFTILNNDKICLCCEKLIKEGHKQIELDDKIFHYCCERCAAEYNPKVAEIETKYGANIKTILTWVISKYKSVEIVKQVLKIDENYLKELVTKYVGTTKG